MNRTSEIYDVTIKNVKLASMHQMFTEFITRVAPLVVIWAGALMILRGKMALGTMVAFYAYLARALPAAPALLGAVDYRFEFAGGDRSAVRVLRRNARS